MEYMYELKEKLCKELEEVARKPEMGAGDLELIHKLTDTIKNIDKIDMLEDGDYSQTGAWGMNGRGSYNRGNSYARRKRDSRGRYSREGNMYSRTDSSDYLMNQLEEMMISANERERDVIRNAMDQLEKM